MRDFITSLKSILKRFPRFLTVLRILRDPRYIYHTLQGYFTSPESRKKLRDIELKILFECEVSKNGNSLFFKR